MDTTKLFAFMQTAKIGSINKAALELGYTQSGLSYTLNKLEDELDVKLLTRMHHGIKLTPQGEELLPNIQNILQQESMIQNKIRQFKEGSVEKIHLGLYPSWMLDWMPHVIRKFRNKHPDVEFEIHTGVLPLKHMLEENLVDIAICEKKIIDRPGWNPLLKDDVYVAVNCNSPFYDAESVDLKDLTTCEMVPSVISNNVVCDIFSKLNMPLPPKFPFYSEDGSMMLSMVSQNDCITFVSRLYESECPENVRLKPTNPAIQKEMGYYVSDAAAEKPYIKSFLKTLNTTTLNYE